VLYSTQTVSLLVTHENTPPSHANVLLSVLRLILLGVTLATALGSARPQEKREQKPAARQASVASGKETFLKYCASCHGENGTGNGPVAVALRPPPSDLTMVSKRHAGKYPAGYVAAVLKFGRSLASHGSDEMPVWGSRFKELDPARDPTGEQHIDDVVAYIASLQTK
jgi:mono/diheme cytochrome c family protein